MGKQLRGYEALEDLQTLQLANQREGVLSSDSLSVSLLCYGPIVTTVVNLGEDMSD